MNDKNKAYYTIKFCHTDAFHGKGQQIAACKTEIAIGQQESCQIRMANDTNFEDEQFAVIKPGENEGEWVIISTSEFYATQVNGTEIFLQQTLRDGDKITFGDYEQTLLFRVRHDENFTDANGIKNIPAGISRNVLVAVILLPVLLFAALGYYIYQDKQEEKIYAATIDEAKNSVLQIAVDSVYYVMNTPESSEIIDSYSYITEAGYSITGTAFLTNDGRIVTARHCIEPWLNDPELTEKLPEEITATPTRWAILAETHNLTTESDTTYATVAVCEFFDHSNKPFGTKILSSAFIYDDSRDNIIETGDFETAWYVRSIKDTPASKDMMLGDVAWVATDSIGSIALADSTYFSHLNMGTKLTFIGYPQYKTTGLETEDGVIKLNFTPGDMITHNGSLIHGYSGGPVIIVNGSKATAIGVLSRIDPTGGERSYSVPVTELKGGENE